MKRGIKLFVWDSPDFTTDWTSGIAFALARTKDEAISLIMADYGDGYGADRARRELEATDPEVYEGPMGSVTFGGG